MKKVRAGAWVVLLALAGVQAWSTRFYATPDGVSYVDLSDAVLNGHWRELLNAYWSPAYPALIGVLRAVLRPTPYWEFAVVHLLNFFLFAASLAGFEYLVRPLQQLGRDQWSKPGLSTPAGLAGAYAVFGAFTLMMTPLTLPTPDLLVSAASLFVFGALLRLRYDIDVARSGVTLGVALAIGSLAKSFAIPWAGICIVTAFVALRGRSWRPAVTSAAIWLLAVLPWTGALSAKYGHLTFGDTGRLTYAWYVNLRETPSGKFMPSAAGIPATDSILEGIAITPNAPGTNPVWYDPSRWYGDLQPEFDLHRQVRVFGILFAEYIGSLAPFFVVMAFWLIVAGREATIAWWRRTWPVVAPAMAALGAYALVLVTTRYVAPFYMAITLTVLCAAAWPARISATRMLVAVSVPVILIVATPEPGRPLALINLAIGAGLFAWAGRYQGPLVQVGAAVIGAVSIRFLQGGGDLRFAAATSAVLILGYWAVARDAEGRDETEMVSALIRRSFIAGNAALVIFVATLKYADSVHQEPADPGEPNSNWFIAGLAKSTGITPGAKIALVGSPFEAYWARAMRSQIVAVVPPPFQQRFKDLAPERRRRLYEEFAKAGADFVVVQQADPPEGQDRSWTPMRYIGWVKRLR